MLDEYNKKRDFKVTAEPKGKPKKSRRRLRFVVQHHLARRDHYDFRLEWQGALLSWAIPKGPSMDPRDKRLAVRVEDHPLDYRNFEGTIPKGEYGGGTVMLWDEGFWEPLSEPEAGLKEGALKFVLKGERLKGSWALIRLKPKKDEDGENWILLKENDEFALDNDGISAYTTSVRTLRTMEEIAEGIQKAQKNPFDNAPFQLARLTERVPEGEDRLFEVKYDGYRIMAYVEGNKARLVTRNGNDLSGKFGEISGALAAFSKGRAMVLDGEIVVADRSGKTDFQALQSFLKKKEQKSLTYIVFDLLALDGEDLREKPLIQRKETLNKLLADAPDNIQYSGHVAGKGGDCFKAACAA
ncbi:MAG TPA: DNA polymerase ligase N-terminal domain-containing protein, partial [Clostridia bacterium]|nr:DNA polymerase ligase N-terminal domain-containing protein [Clostridia bacterium]